MSQPATDQSEDICLGCGLCCSGVLFASVRIRPEEDPERLRALGLAVTTVERELRFLQPCPCHAGRGCAVYRERPATCAKFRCELLKRHERGEVGLAETKALIARVTGLIAAHDLRARLEVITPERGLDLRALLAQVDAAIAASPDPAALRARHAQVLTIAVMVVTLLNRHFYREVA